jgi:hypothetical protein
VERIDFTLTDAKRQTSGRNISLGGCELAIEKSLTTPLGRVPIAWKYATRASNLLTGKAKYAGGRSHTLTRAG